MACFGMRSFPPVKPTGSGAVVPKTSDRARAKMAEDTLTTSGIGRHGATRLPSVDVDSYNIELKDDEGFLGDRASKGAFRKILDSLRKPLKKNGEDPLGSKSAEVIGKSALDEALVGDDVPAAAWSRPARKRRPICRRPRSGSPSSGAMPMTSRPGRAP